jgi:hypothetical protein
MFLSNSRYFSVPTVETTGSDGVPIVTLKMRPLQPTSGQPYSVKDRDQLDHFAVDKYGDPTRFWHIADANTEFDSRDLLRETGSAILVPDT